MISMISMISKKKYIYIYGHGLRALDRERERYIYISINDHINDTHEDLIFDISIAANITIQADF